MGECLSKKINGWKNRQIIIRNKKGRGLKKLKL
jgi:hypothetical protein